MFAAHEPCSVPQLTWLGPKQTSSSAPEKVEIKKAGKRRASKFSKRRRAVLKKVHDLHRDCDVEVYFMVQNKRSNQIWQYTTGILPPSQAELVRDAKHYIDNMH
jgi:hypothetical protein